MPSPISDHFVPWPAEDVRRYMAQGYWTGEPLGGLLRAAADRNPDAPAVIDPTAAGGLGVRLSHQELADRADVAAVRLLELGITRGDRIVVQLGNGWEFVVLTVLPLVPWSPDPIRSEGGEAT
jgi:2,3-dihydroxybenzoate-AMP ligase